MAADLIISALDIDKENMNGSFYVVKSTDCCESSFVTSCILGHQMRTKSPMILVTLHQTFEHYLDISAKMGTNMKQPVENKSLVILDYSDTVLDQELSGNSVNPRLLSEIKKNIAANVDKISEKYDSICVYIDDLTHLLDISLDIKSIIKFVKEIMSISNNSVIFINAHVAMSGDTSDLLTNILRTMSTSFIELNPLPTGRSKEVSGHMQVTQFRNFFFKDNLLDIHPQNYHFKLFDRGVKVFTPGTL